MLYLDREYQSFMKTNTANSSRVSSAFWTTRQQSWVIINGMWHINHKHTLTAGYVAKNLSVIIGIVLIWRGTWYALDAIDMFLFNGSPAWTSIGGIILGVVVLYLPDKDLKELGRL